MTFPFELTGFAGRPFAVLLGTAGVTMAVVIWSTVVRVRITPEESPVWNRFLLGALVLCASVLAGTLPAALVERPSAQLEAFCGAFFAVGCLLAAPFFYQGLIQWNRIRTSLSASEDWLNGVSAVLVVEAGINAFLPVPANVPPVVLDGYRQVSIGVVACSVVMIGTVLSVYFLAGLARDVRIWLVGTAMVSFGVAPLFAVLGKPVTAGPVEGLALVAALLLVAAAKLPPPVLAPISTTGTQATTIGSLVVLVGGVALLIVDGDLLPGGGPLVTVYATLAIAGGCARFVQMIRDLAQLAQTRHEANTDDLTGIPNRRALIRAMEGALEEGMPTTLLLVDLDRFKIVNDRYGHAVGDELLRRVATAFADVVPARALLARLGGDEFAVLLTGDAVGWAQQVAWRMVEVVLPHLDLEERPVQVGASIGIAEALDPAVEGIDGVELLRRADTAMYQAKTAQAGVSVYDGLVDARALAQLQLVEEMERVLAPGSPDAEQIQVHFQPQVDVVTDQVVGAEALVRWNHPSQGLLGPERFIDLVEENGLMPLLTDRVVRQAAAEWKHWQRAGHRLRVSVNLSASSLVHPSLLAVLDDVIAAGVDPDRFVLEITETSLMVDPDRALATMRGIARQGFGFSIDDYGTGYSSLSYLNDLPATELKIDRSFTMRILTDARTAAIVAGTVQLAHRLGMRLIVEGVEDLETLRALHEMGCNEAQGYLHSRPLASESFRVWLEHRTADVPA